MEKFRSKQLLTDDDLGASKSDEERHAFMFFKPKMEQVDIDTSGRLSDYVSGVTAESIKAASLTRRDAAMNKFIKTSNENLGLNLPHVQENVSGLDSKLIENISQLVTVDPLLTTLAIFIGKTNVLGSDYVSKVIRFKHILAVAYTESRFDPFAENISTVHTPKGEYKDIHFGLMQQSKANWDHAIPYFHQSPQGESVTESGIIGQIAKFMGVNFDAFNEPYDEWRNKNISLFQCIPILGQAIYLMNALNENFVFTSRWRPVSSAIEEGDRWRNLTSLYPNLMKDYYVGRHAILSYMHGGGVGVFEKPGVYKYIDATHEQCLAFAKFLLDTNLDDVIKYIVNASNVDVTLYSFMPAGDPDPGFFKARAGYKTKIPKLHYSVWNPITNQYDIAGYKVNSYYGYRDLGKGKTFHHAIDLNTNVGTPIYAPGDGKLSGGFEASGGNFVTVSHPLGYSTTYRHLSWINKDLYFNKTGKPVSKGTLIGKTGNTGTDTQGPHVHWEVHKWNADVNPDDKIQNPYLDPYSIFHPPLPKNMKVPLEPASNLSPPTAWLANILKDKTYAKSPMVREKKPLKKRLWYE